MAGHGSPLASLGRFLSRAAADSRMGWAALMLLLCAAANGLGSDDLRVRIAWGGAERAWHGTISISDGSLSEPQPLGIEADEPGSMWLDGDSRRQPKTRHPTAQPARLRRRRRAGRRAAPARSCSCNFRPPTIPTGPATIEIPLADLSGEFVNKELDNRGNRLLVMRTPGDSLRVQSRARQSGVRARRDVQVHARTARPAAWPTAAGRGSRFNCSAAAARSFGRSSTTCRPAATATIPLEIAAAQRGGRLRRRHRGRQQSELVAGGPPAVELEADDRRAARATAGAESAAAGRRAGRSRVHAGGRDRSGQSAMVREAQQAAAVAVDQGPAAAAVEGPAGQRLPADAAARAGRVGPVEARTPTRPT